MRLDLSMLQSTRTYTVHVMPCLLRVDYLELIYK